MNRKWNSFFKDMFFFQNNFVFLHLSTIFSSASCHSVQRQKAPEKFLIISWQMQGARQQLRWWLVDHPDVQSRLLVFPFFFFSDSKRHQMKSFGKTTWKHLSWLTLRRHHQEPQSWLSSSATPLSLKLYLINPLCSLWGNRAIHKSLKHCFSLAHHNRSNSIYPFPLARGYAFMDSKAMLTRL